MSHSKPKILTDHNSRKLVSRILRENFHLYTGRYLLAFLLMGCTALATALSVFMMKKVTAVVFGSAEALKETPVITGGASPLVAEWTQRLSSFVASLFVSSQPGLVQILSVAIAIVLIFLMKGLSEYGSSPRSATTWSPASRAASPITSSTSRSRFSCISRRAT